MSSDDVPWWGRIDRQAVVEAVRSLVRDPKVFALIGQPSSGLNEAATIAQAEFRELGRRCMRISDLDVPLPTVKYLLLKLLDGLASPNPPGALVPSLFHASSGVGEIGSIISRTITSLGEPLVLIIDRIDSQQFPRRNEIFGLQEIARVSNTPILLTGDSGYQQWDKSLPQGSLISLADFGRNDVRECMLAAAPLAGWSHQRIDEKLDSMFGGSMQLSPLDAFSHLKVLAL